MNKVDDGLRALLREWIPEFQWTTVENGVGRGCPDVEYCHRGAQGWIECKAASAWAVKMRPEQVAWLSRRAREGGRCWIAVRRHIDRRSSRVTPCDELWLIEGIAASKLAECGLNGLDARWVALRCGGGPSRWAWDAMRRELTSSIFDQMWRSASPSGVGSTTL